MNTNKQGIKLFNFEPPTTIYYENRNNKKHLSCTLSPKKSI